MRIAIVYCVIALFIGAACGESDEEVARSYCQQELACDPAGFGTVYANVDQCTTVEAAGIAFFSAEYGRGGAYRDLLDCMANTSCPTFNQGRPLACPDEWDRVTR